MPPLTLLPLATYAAGSYSFEPVYLPRGTSGLVVMVARCTSQEPEVWPDASTTIRADMQFSFDGGVTYSDLGANSAGPMHGGIIDTGVSEVALWSFGWRFVPDATHVKGTFTVDGGEVRTMIALAGA